MVFLFLSGVQAANLLRLKLVIRFLDRDRETVISFIHFIDTDN
jgi:hypothetical protein